jgi:hypothetical protein
VQFQVSWHPAGMRLRMRMRERKTSALIPRPSPSSENGAPHFNRRVLRARDIGYHAARSQRRAGAFRSRGAPAGRLPFRPPRPRHVFRGAARRHGARTCRST